MIAFVRGLCRGLTGDTAVIEVGGVGLLVTCTATAIAGLRPGEETELATALVIREDAWTLYGFASEDERRVFEMLQSVTGVGPRLALAAVGRLGAAGLVSALAAGDVSTLTSVPGVGRKTAERLVLELREKVGELGALSPSAVPAAVADRPQSGWQSQVADALVGLGWQLRDAEAAVRAVASDLPPDGPLPSVPALLRRALSRLDRV